MKRCAKFWQWFFCLALIVCAPRALAQALQSGLLDQWTWRSPLPTGNQLNGVCFGNNLFVACGELGTVLTSLDATNWILVPSGTTDNLTATTFGNGLFTCLTDQGSILVSENGTNWNRVSSVSANPLKSIVYGNGEFVAVGGAGTIVSSTDGTNWILQTSGTTQPLISVTYAQGLFVAVGFNGTILSSPDAVIWTMRNALPFDFSPLSAVGYGNAQFVALVPVNGFGFGQTSSDGMNWIASQSTPNPGFGSAIAYGGNGLFIAVGGAGFFGSIMLSTNGTDWVNENWLPELIQILHGVCYADSHFVAVGEAGTILVSTDGSTWSQMGADEPALVNGSFSELTAVAWGNKHFVASRSRKRVAGSTGALLLSSDAIAWTNVLAGTTPAGLNSVCYGNGEFVAAGENGTLMTSSNAVDWTSITTSIPTLAFYGASYVNNGFVVVGQNGTVLTSSDATTWVNRTPAGVLGGLASVTYGNDIYVAVGNNGAGFATILTSSDGTNWTSSIPANSYFPLSGIAFGSGLFVAVGVSNGAGGILVSKDGVGWTQVLSQGQPLLSTIFAYGLFVVVGQSGTILSSPDGQAWTGHTLVTSDALNGVVEDNKQFIVVGGHDTILGNQPKIPVLPIQQDRTIFGQTRLVVTNSALFSDAQALSYKLTTAPLGATIDANGVITWTPDLTQEPSTNLFITVVTDNGVVQNSATNSFMVTALPSNQPPILTVPDTVKILEGQVFTLQISATDVDDPASSLGFNLGPGAPSGAAITTTGLFSWTPTESQAPSTNSVNVCVSDGTSTVCKSIQIIILEDPLEILSQPHGGSFGIGSDIILSVVADGATAISYQWQFNGTNLAGATQSILTLSNAQPAQAGFYSVTVSNQNGTISTTPVLVEIPSLPPVLAQPGNYVVNVGQIVAFTNAVSESDPALKLTFSLDSAPVGATITSDTGIFLWQPPVSSAGTTNRVVVRVTDSGAPPLADTKAFFISVNALPPDSLPLSGLIGWWPGEGSADDVAGLNPGVLVNSVGFTNGLIGRAFQFHGENDSVKIPNSTELNPQTFTIEAWVYPLMSQTQAVIVAKGSDTDPSGLNLQLVTNSDGALVLSGTTWGITNYWTTSIELQSTNSVPLNAWTHVAMTLDNQGMSLYLNGAPDTTTEGTPAFALIALTNAAPLSIGGGSGPSFNGLIDEILFYDRALSAEQIQKTYAIESLGGPLPPQIFSPPQDVSPGIGTDAHLSVTAISPGGTPLFYQWSLNGTSIAGATNFTLFLKNVQPSDSGQYSVMVSNAAGAVTSLCSVSVAGVIAWGSPNHDGELNVPSGLVSVKAIACGGSHNLASRADGTVVAWGDNVQGQIDVPPGLSNVVAITAASTYSMALTASGQIVGWGIGPITVPPGLTNVVAIAAGNDAAWALQSNGVLVGWNGFGGRVSLPSDWTNLVGVAAGRLHVLGLRSDGTVVASGDDSYGQTDVPAGLTNVVALAANLLQSVALKSDGTVVAWGVGLTANVALTNTPADLSNVVAIAAGETFNLALRSDGTVAAWGQDSYGNPVSSPTLPNTVSIAAGDFHGLALLRDGSPQITVQPWDRQIQAGTTASLTTKAVGLKGTAYQWQFNGKIIDGATNDTYTVADAKPGDAGSYSLVASNHLGTAVTRQATVVVSSPYALSVLGVGGKVTISWPSMGTSGLFLEEASSLTTPTIWAMSAAAVSDDGTNKTATVSATSGARFFRLATR